MDKYKRKYYDLIKKQKGGRLIREKNNYYCTVGTIIIHDNNIVLFGEQKGTNKEYIYSFPAGGCETDQSLALNAARECREETANLLVISHNIFTVSEESNNFVDVEAFDEYCTDAEKHKSYIRCYCIRIKNFNPADYESNVNIIAENINKMDDNKNDTGIFSAWKETTKVIEIPLDVFTNDKLSHVDTEKLNKKNNSFDVGATFSINNQNIDVSYRAMICIKKLLEKGIIKNILKNNAIDESNPYLRTTVVDSDKNSFLIGTNSNIIISVDEGFKHNDMLVTLKPNI
jgi:hypothetical protein